jgi:hypothetical protein
MTAPIYKCVCQHCQRVTIIPRDSVALIEADASAVRASMTERERASALLDKLAWETVLAEEDGDLDATRIAVMRREIVEAAFARERADAVAEHVKVIAHAKSALLNATRGYSIDPAPATGVKP